MKNKYGNRTKLWFRFLREKCIYGQYMYNLNEYIKQSTRFSPLFISHNVVVNNVQEYLYYFTKKDSLLNIFNTFRWHDTNEGHSFWAKINREWQNILINNFNL